MERLNPNFNTDYEEFLCEYVLPLLGIDVVTNRALFDRTTHHAEKTETILQENGCLSFYISGWHVLSVPCSMRIPEDDLAVCRRILQSFPDIAQYKMTGMGRHLPSAFPYDMQKQALYRTAIQNGISRWLAGDHKNNNIDQLFNELETWAVKTYEGKTVTMGFIINPEAESDFGIGKQKWLQFMRDDTAAMLTDCIHSVIELDPKCNFVEYHSLSDQNYIPGCELSYKAPLRFLQMIQTHVTDKKRGVFLLNNGDIVLAKEQEIRFVRRNLRWLNFSYRAFRNSLDSFVLEAQKEKSVSTEQLESLLENVFASVLDVSFSHAGGIIAVVGGEWVGSVAVQESEEVPILASSDDLLNPEYDREDHTEDFRALKRCVIKELVKEKSFGEMDRKLRGELLGLDGACILTYDGRVQSFGAIIQNDKGSDGGGRSAAAKKLSQYGMSVKISTDGYIEVYTGKKLVYSIK